MTEPVAKKSKSGNVPNGGKGRPPGAKNRGPIRGVYAVDKFRSTQSKEWVAEFDYWVTKFRPPVRDVYDRLKEAGYQETWSSVQNWLRNLLPVGEEARRINELASRMAGMDTHGILEMTLAQSASVLDKAMKVLNDRNLDSMPVAEVARLISPLTKEVRATATKLQELQVLGDSHEIELSGAVAIIEYLYQTFEDNPVILPPLKEACRAALAKLQGE